MKFKSYLIIFIFSLNIFLFSAKNIEQNKNNFSGKNNKNVYLKPGIKKHKKKILPYAMVGMTIIALLYIFLKKNVTASECWEKFNFSTNFIYNNNKLKNLNPNPYNNWDDTCFFRLLTTSRNFSTDLILEIFGCDGGIRKDTIYIDNLKVFEKTTKFDKNYKFSEIIFKLKTRHYYKIRHVIDLSEN